MLLEGACTLYIGHGDAVPDRIEPLVIEKKKLYNVKHEVCYNLTAVAGKTLLIVENTDTTEVNSNDFAVTPEMLS